MTEDQAKFVQSVVLAGTVQRERSELELDFLRRYLLPLPYEHTLRKVEEYVAVVGRDKDGKATHSWITTPGELLEACGLPDKPGVRAELVRAIREGGELLPDLRSIDGWSYVPPGAEKPRGVLEAEAVAAESSRPQRQALPPPLPPRPALAAEADRRIAEIAKAKTVTRETRPERKGPTPAQLEAELAMANARFKAELARAEASERGDGREVEVEDLLPY